MAKMEYTTIEELEDRHLGKVGTPRRDAFEASVKEEIRAYHLGEAIKSARNGKSLSQEQLGELMGVRKSEVSRIESGRNITVATLARAFRAMGVPAAFTFGGNTLPLW